MFSSLLAVVIVALSVSRVLAGVCLNGVNIAGFDFGCDGDVRTMSRHGAVDTDQSMQGYCLKDGVTPPLLTKNGRNMPYIHRFKFYSDGPGQMQHFAKKHGMNVFRLPVAWQFLVDRKVGERLDPKNAGLYDDLVQACLKTGAYCMIDIHNYGRWDGKIIGQGCPTDKQFASLWWHLGRKYKNQRKIMMGLMNEPHSRM